MPDLRLRNDKPRPPICVGCPLWEGCEGFDAKYCAPNADAGPPPTDWPAWYADRAAKGRRADES